MKLTIFVLTFILVTESFGSDIHAKWERHKQIHNKTYYNAVDETLSKEKFIKLDKMIIEHNKHAAAGNISYTVGHNQFSDDILENIELTLPDVKGKREGFLPVRTYVSTGVKIPKSFDWRKKGWNVPVRDHGRCGSCWAFAITGSIEAQIFKKYNKIVTLSPQELIDCSSEYGTSGCRSGSIPSGFNYVYDKGLTEDEIYPYQAKNLSCRANIYESRRYKISGISMVQFGDAQALREAIYKKGPLAIGIFARFKSFINYKGGLYNGFEINDDQTTGQQCPSRPTRAVLLVGYGVTQNGSKYWIIKNSWNAEIWGEKGYMYLLDNGSDICGITAQAFVPELI